MEAKGKSMTKNKGVIDDRGALSSRKVLTRNGGS